MSKGLRIVVPDGSMQKKVMDLFCRAGLPIFIPDERTAEGEVNAKWISQVSFRRPERIPMLLNRGHYDVAIVGQDWLANWGFAFPVLLEMAMGRAGTEAVKIVLAVLNDSPYQSARDFPQDGVVASEYELLAKNYFVEIGRPDIQVDRTPGKTEAEIRHDAIAIIDVTESGKSLRKNGLRIIDELMISNTVIVAHPDALADAGKKPCIDWFVRLMKGAYQASLHMELIANVPESMLDQAAKIIGGLKGPTYSPVFGQNGWYSLMAIVPRDQWDRISYELLQLGVTDIIPRWDIPCIMC